MSKQKIQMACGDVVILTPVTKKEAEEMYPRRQEQKESQKPFTGRTLRNNQLNKEHELWGLVSEQKRLKLEG